MSVSSCIYTTWLPTCFLFRLHPGSSYSQSRFCSGQNISQSVRVYITRLLTCFVTDLFSFLEGLLLLFAICCILVIQIPTAFFAPLYRIQSLICDFCESLFSCAKLRSKDTAQEASHYLRWILTKTFRNHRLRHFTKFHPWFLVCCPFILRLKWHIKTILSSEVERLWIKGNSNNKKT